MIEKLVHVARIGKILESYLKLHSSNYPYLCKFHEIETYRDDFFKNRKSYFNRKNVLSHFGCKNIKNKTKSYWLPALVSWKRFT